MEKDYDVECGEHRGRVTAASATDAWRKVTAGQKHGFAKLGRVREAFPKRRPWLYATPEGWDAEAAKSSTPAQE